MRTTLTASKQDLSKATVVDSFMEYLRRHIEWSEQAFGPEPRREGVLKHLEKEIEEVRKAKTANEAFLEWIDIIILGLDGAQRELKGEPDIKAVLILEALFAKQALNKQREWPNHGDPDRPIEHNRGAKRQK